MYEEFFGLKEKPFQPTPNPKYMYFSKSHKDAINKILFSFENREGFALLIGDVGVGKTLVAKYIAQKLEEKGAKYAYIYYPVLTTEELLQLMLLDFGIKVRSKRKSDMIKELYNFMISNYSQGKIVATIIDEAHAFPPDTLEELRLLTNLETESSKLLQILLVGQPEIYQLLEMPRLRQIMSRIQVVAKLEPLSREDTEKYIYHRLTVAGSKGDIVFKKSAIDEIWRFSRGIPRLINIICDKTLIVAYTYGTKTITAKHVKLARQATGLAPEPRVYQPSLTRTLLLGLGLAVFSASVTLTTLLVKSGIERKERKVAEEVRQLQIPKPSSPLEPFFALVNIVPPPDVKDIESFAKAFGLEIVPLRIRRELVSEIKFPVLLDTGEKSYLIKKIEGDFAVLWTPDGDIMMRVPRTIRVKIIVDEKFDRMYLVKGSASPEVRKITQYLYELGYLSRPKGVFDDEVKRAVIQFQKDKGLQPDGVVGPLTRIILLQEWKISKTKRT